MIDKTIIPAVRIDDLKTHESTIKTAALRGALLFFIMRDEKTGAGNAPVPVLSFVIRGRSGVLHNNCFDGIGNMLTGV